MSDTAGKYEKEYELEMQAREKEIREYVNNFKRNNKNRMNY